RGAFRAGEIPGGRLLLVDDVCTTGATARACASELLGSGARRVWLATVTAAPAPCGSAAFVPRPL
ncbi:MAG: phosphoribosyltransferase, partial [Myxococcota bacterium]|nr:phosphoribosyltransferase [Myxococcota bacterium]